MAQCTYHPDKKGSASCPTCHQPICDKCRLQGNSLRCGTCQSAYQKGGDDPNKKTRIQCHNHQGVPTDQRCLQCRKPFCAACLNSASKCFNCAMAAPAAPAPRGARGGPKAGTGKLGAKGKPGKPAAKGRHGVSAAKAGGPKVALPWPMIGGVVAGVLVVALAATALKPKPKAPYVMSGPMKVAIVGPSTARALSGPQVISLKVASPDDLDKVEVTVDGKYWARLREEPFESDWPTSLIANGRHTLVAKAYYKNKKAVTDQRVVTTRNH